MNSLEMYGIKGVQTWAGPDDYDESAPLLGVSRSQTEPQRVVKGIEWKTDYNDGSMYVSNCRFSDRILMNLKDRKWILLSQIAAIGVCALVLAIAIPILIHAGPFIAPIVLLPALFGSMLAGTLGIFFTTGFICNLISLPCVLNIRISQVFVEIIGQERIKSLPVFRRGEESSKSIGLSILGDCESAGLQYEYKYSESGEVVKDSKYSNSREESSEIGSVKQIEDFETYIHILKRANKNSLTGPRIQEILDETKANYLFVRNRMERLIRGEQIESLRGKGSVKLVS